MSRWQLMAVALTALMALSPEARAEDYPTHNVTILVPFAPGGGTDLLARAYAQILEEKYGKTFVIENRPGGGTTIAATTTANATPDGYTLMQGTSGTMAMNPTIFKHLSYEPLKTLVPVSLVAGVPFVLTVNPTLPVHSVAELVALAKKRSAEGKPLTYGSGGVGAFHHLCAEQQPDWHQDDTRSLPRQRAIHCRADCGRDRRALRRPGADAAADQCWQGPCTRHHER